MTANNPTPPSGESVSGESAVNLKCRDCGFEWPYTGAFLRKVSCPGCATVTSALDARTYYLLRWNEAAVTVEVTVPPEIAQLAELHREAYGTRPEDLYHDLLNPTPEFVEESTE